MLYHGLRGECLPGRGEGADACAAVDGGAVVVTVAELGRPAVEGGADLKRNFFGPRLRVQGTLKVAGGGDRGGRGVEHRESAVALAAAAYHGPAVGANTCRD